MANAAAAHSLKRRRVADCYISFSRCARPVSRERISRAPTSSPDVQYVSFNVTEFYDGSPGGGGVGDPCIQIDSKLNVGRKNTPDTELVFLSEANGVRGAASSHR